MHYMILNQYKSIINLISESDLIKVFYIHYFDSILSLYFIYPRNQVIDIGSGAGFPGILTPILFQNIKIILLDSLMKKIFFLNYCLSIIRIKGAQAQHFHVKEIQWIDSIIFSRAVFSWLPFYKNKWTIRFNLIFIAWLTLKNYNFTIKRIKRFGFHRLFLIRYNFNFKNIILGFCNNSYAPERIRTFDIRNRNPMLYPAELQAL